MVLEKGGSEPERALQHLAKKEARLVRQRRSEQPSALERALSGKIPARLERTLTLAFSKAFALVFSKGGSFAQKTYSKEARQESVSDALHAAREHPSRASLRRVSKGADRSANRHLLLAGAEGGGLGLLGIGLPDIPLFSGLLLRTMREIAASFGFSYDSPAERLFILHLIEVSLLRGEAFLQADEALTRWVDTGQGPSASEKVQLQRTAAALSEHLLYLKFVQGIPLIGLIGGLSDAVCLRRVSYYARLKYKRRFLQQGAPSSMR